VAIRLMIVDDSSVARAVLTRMIMAQDGFQVVAAAASASEALSLLRCISVDIILLDIEMPGGSGLEALPALIEAGRGARVLIVSSAADDRASASMRALSMGAADTIAKPGTGMFGGRFSEILCERLRRIGANPLRDPGAAPAAPATPILLREVHDWRPACIAIGASTGGIHAIKDFLAGLPDETGLPIFVTQHLPPLFMPFFARQLAAASGRRTRVVEEGETVEPDQIHVAPGNAHLRLERRGSRVRVRLDAAPAPSGCLPSADPMMESVGETYGEGALCVMLSGMGRDGLIGSRKIVARGGVVLAQDQYSATIWGMPRAVAEAGLATAVLPPRDLARRVASRLGSPAWK
jgi:two-component system chemotaxis response regulator CheB